MSALGLLLLLLLARPAYAGRGGIVVINSGADVIHIRDLSADAAEATGYDSLGYRYDLFGVFWLDLWRWGGEFVVYTDKGYAPLTDEQLDILGGASMPWKYRAPPGLLIILALLELAAVTHARRRAKVVLALGGVWLAVAALLYIKGVDVAFAIPGLLGLHHVIATLFALRTQANPDEGEPMDEPDEPELAPDTSPHGEPQVAMRPSPPNVETDPFRAPPRPPPIEVIQPAPAPAEPPIAIDESAEKPKLLG